MPPGPHTGIALHFYQDMRLMDRAEGNIRYTADA
jgi:hypothetical protein